MVKTEKNGKLFYAWDEVQAGRSRSNEHSQQLGSGQLEVGKGQQHTQLADAMGSLHWSLAQKSVAGQSGSSGSNPAISDGQGADLTLKLPRGAEEALLEAMLAGDKLMKSGHSALKNMPQDNKYFSDAKEYMKALKDSCAKADHWVTWKEKEDGRLPSRDECDALLYQIAEAVSNVNSAIEVCRGWIKGRS